MSQPNLWQTIDRLPVGTTIRVELPTRRSVNVVPLQEDDVFSAAVRTARAAGTSLSLELLKANGWDPTEQRPVPASSGAAPIPHWSSALTVKLDPAGLKERVDALLRAVSDKSEKVDVVSKAKDATGAAKYTCDIFTLNYPGLAPAFQAPVAGLAVLASAADFRQEWASHKFRGSRLVVKGAVLAIDAADLAGIIGLIPNSGLGLKTTGLVLRGLDKVMAIFQD